MGAWIDAAGIVNERAATGFLLHFHIWIIYRHSLRCGLIYGFGHSSTHCKNANIKTMNVSALFPPFNPYCWWVLNPWLPFTNSAPSTRGLKGKWVMEFLGSWYPCRFPFPHSLAYLKCLQITAMGISRGLYGKSVYVLGDFIWSAAAFWPNWQTFLWTKGRRPPTRIPYMKRHAGLLCIQIGFGWEVKGERCM